MTLTEFLTARLDQDEASARGATADPGVAAQWNETTSGCLDIGRPDYGDQNWHDYVWTQGDSRVTRFIASHDPARTLREIAAKRKILAIHHVVDAIHHLVRGGYCHGCGDNAAGYWTTLTDECPEKRALAAVYADHPDYRPEWAPEES